jgi:subtilisin family serine protease
MVSAAGADMVKKIIIFHKDVSQEERNQYATDWEPYGVSTVMDLPFINGMVLMVPVEISSADLVNDNRVASVESDQKMELQAVEATGEGGAGEGGATNFIKSTDPVPRGHRPWGTLYLYDYLYDPMYLTTKFVSSEVADVVKEAIFSNNLDEVRVAIFDTGVDTKHADLRRKIEGGIDLVNMIDDIPEDDNGHGTHVSGTLCGRDIGIAPYVPIRLYVVKVLDEFATGDISTLIMGLQWAIENQIDIINMSIAFRDDNPAVRLAIKKAHEAGVMMIAAAGNHSNWEDEGGTGEGGAGEGGAGEGGAGEGGAGEGGAADGGTLENPYPVMYPARYPEVIAVGAIDIFENFTEFSNTGVEVDVLAPGTDIISTDVGGGYGLCSGTSMATPHVTGAVSMMLARAKDLNKTLSPEDVKTILKETALNGTINLIGALEHVIYYLP